jgi:hypothetical protein
MIFRRSRDRLAAAAFLVGIAACAPTAAPPTTASPEDASVGLQAPAIISAPMSYLVNFRPSHALGRAQAMQRAGRYAEAELLVGTTLRDDQSLRGLCFERFTVGGAEIVLNVCSPSPWEERSITQRRWLEQLGVTPGVAYVERNLVAQRAAEPPRS